MNTTDSRPYQFSFTSFATWHHIYKENWLSTLEEMLTCVREPNNGHDPNA